MLRCAPGTFEMPSRDTNEAAKEHLGLTQEFRGKSMSKIVIWNNQNIKLVFKALWQCGITFRVNLNTEGSKKLS